MDDLIPVGEIDTHGHFCLDSLFWHRENAERYAKLLLRRGAYRVSVGGVVFALSPLAREAELRAKEILNGHPQLRHP